MGDPMVPVWDTVSGWSTPGYRRACKVPPVPGPWVRRGGICCEPTDPKGVSRRRDGVFSLAPHPNLTAPLERTVKICVTCRLKRLHLQVVGAELRRSATGTGFIHHRE